MDQCTAQELGLLAWSVTRGRLTVCANDGGEVCMLGALMQAARINSEGLHWRGIAHIELVARLHVHGEACTAADSNGVQPVRKRKRAEGQAQGEEEVKEKEEGEESAGGGPAGGCRLADKALDSALATRMAGVMQTMAADSDAHNAAPSLLCREALLAGSLASSCAAPREAGVNAAKETVLLVGDDVGGGTRDALVVMGYEVVHWRRFAWEGVSDGGAVNAEPPTAWPVAPSTPYAACVMRFSAAGVDAVAMHVQAVAPTVRAGTVRVFRQNHRLGDAIGSHSCHSFRESTALIVVIINYVETLKAVHCGFMVTLMRVAPPRPSPHCCTVLGSSAELSVLKDVIGSHVLLDDEASIHVGTTDSILAGRQAPSLIISSSFDGVATLKRRALF
jgi:hypothetical protein